MSEALASSDGAVNLTTQQALEAQPARASAYVALQPSRAESREQEAKKAEQSSSCQVDSA